MTGIIWDDYVEPKLAKIKIKREPPEPVWLADNYLPSYEEAKAWQPNLMSDAEIMTAKEQRKKLIWDTEFYENYALLGFLEPDSNKIIMFERFSKGQLQQVDKLKWIAQNFTLVGFNDTLFDVPMLHATLNGHSTEQLKKDVTDIIFGDDGNGLRPFEFYKRNKIIPFNVDNIDLIALTPLGPSLKRCAGRMHAPRMADLPFHIDKILLPEQITILRWYWSNDLQNTSLLHNVHKTAINLREILSEQYGVDVRSKSDPQIAEQVIRKEITRLTGRQYIQRAKIIPWRSFRYIAPSYLDFKTETLKWVKQFICRQDFVVDDKGSPTMPPELNKMDIRVANATYRIGMGGLHSQEKRTIQVADEEHELTDNDVVSYYPMLMIKGKMFPPNVGPEFLYVFTSIIDRRIAAKKAGDKATAETLKIVGNGTFGKTGEAGGYSVVYYPEMMIQVTVTGQLTLLLLIERLELADIAVVSGNTDGIVVKCPKHLCSKRDEIFKQWEKDTGLELESKAYKALYSKDVNNYIAILSKPDTKEQGVWQYAKAIGAYRKTIDVYPLKWNPTCEICTEALINYLATGKSMEETIRECQDVRKFLEVRQVAGGACKDGEYLGKALRWYYSNNCPGEVINAKNGHIVPRSIGARPCMILPACVPDDIDYLYYVERALGMLDDFYEKGSRHNRS